MNTTVIFYNYSVRINALFFFFFINTVKPGVFKSPAFHVWSEWVIEFLRSVILSLQYALFFTRKKIHSRKIHINIVEYFY